MRETTCAFSGYRPSKLPWGQNEDDDRCRLLKHRLTQTLVTLYGRGYRHFICGMAQGCDIYFAEAVLALRDRYPDVSLEAAIPCPTQADEWPERERTRYRALRAACDVETTVQRRYTHDCMHRRNRYMVQRSSLLLAVFDGTPGGTAYTVQQAVRAGLEVIRLDPDPPLRQE